MGPPITTPTAQTSSPNSPTAIHLPTFPRKHQKSYQAVLVPSTPHARHPNDSHSNTPPSPSPTSLPTSSPTPRPTPTPSPTPHRRRQQTPSSSTNPTPPPQQPSPQPQLNHDFDTLDSLISLPASIKHLHPTLCNPFINTCERLASAFLADKTDKHLFDILSLVKLGLTPGLKHGHTATKSRLAAFPNVPAPPSPSPTSISNNPVKRAKTLIEAGFISKAERALNDSAKVAPLTPDTIQALVNKHPVGPHNPFQLPLHQTVPHPNIPSIDDIGTALRSFSRDTSPGISGWSVKLLSLAMSSSAFSDFILYLTSHVCAGDCIGQQPLCSARLTPLLKPDGGIRPIAVGEMFYRLITKAIFTCNYDTNFLHPNQLGVGSKGGIETITRAVQYAADNHPDFQYKRIFSLDFSNAFNTTSRPNLFRMLKKYAPSLIRPASWAHNTPSPLLVHAEGNTHTLSSSDGVREGDPLAALLFSISIRNLIERLSTQLGSEFLLYAYLDDIVILAPEDSNLDVIFQFFDDTDSPISLNMAKCRSYTLDYIRRAGLRILGTCVGSRAARATFLEEKVSQLELDLECLTSLPKQHALLILRTSLQAKLRHLQRSLYSPDLQHIWARLDNSIWDAFDLIRGITPTHDRQRDRSLLSLPPSLGGLGLLSHIECAPLAYAAASSLADTALSKHAPSLEPDDVTTQRAACKDAFHTKQQDLMASFNLHEKVCFVENISPISRRWLTAYPTSNRFSLTDAETQANLLYRTLMPSYLGPCQKCAADNILGHDEACPGRPDLALSRHNAIRDNMSKALSLIPGVTAQIEPYATRAMTQRNDIRIRSDGDSSAPLIEDFDIKIVALTSPSHHKAILVAKLPPSAPEDIADNTRLRMSLVLANQARRKTLSLAPSTAHPEPLLAPMVPLVISTGGVMDKQTEEKMKQWKRWGMPVGMYTWMMTSIGVTLAKARGRTMIAARSH